MQRFRWNVAARVASLLMACSCVCSCEAEDGVALSSIRSALTIPRKGATNRLEVANWNVEWFGDPNNGPSNNTLQRTNVHDVIAGADFDVWALEEIVSQTEFNTLEAALPGYTGFTSAEAVVTNGSSYYTASEQKLAILYKSSIATLVSAKVILTANDYDFAGRPPLEVKLNVTVDGTTAQVVVIVVHMKATDDTASWQRRQNAANALKTYLDATYPTQKVTVVGDFNDDLDTSITTGKPTPYAAFVSDAADYTFPTKEFSDASVSTTVSYVDAVDHQLATNDLYANYVAESADVYRVDEYIANYGTTTSDHFPVFSQYQLTPGGGGGGSDGGVGGIGDVIVNEILANEAGSNVDGEFVELLNVGTGAADLSGFTLRDSTAIRHTFPSGTILQAGKALVVFGGAASIPSGVTNAIGASTGGLNLANGGDSVIFRNASGATLDSFTYSSSLSGTDGVSMNRNPDTTKGASFVLHTTLSSLTSSPGKRVSGAAF